jgi:hypothetical protein
MATLFSCHLEAMFGESQSHVRRKPKPCSAKAKAMFGESQSHVKAKAMSKPKPCSKQSPVQNKALFGVELHLRRKYVSQ